MAKEQLKPEELKVLSTKINDLFASAKLDDVTAESAGFSDAPDGYFLCEVKSAQFGLSKSGNAQVAFRFQIVEDGRDTSDVSQVLKKTKGISIFKYYRLEEDKDAKKFVSDMIKFEIDEKGTSIPKEAFTSMDTIENALELITGLNIYVNNSVDIKDDGSKSTWVNLISWKRAAELGLPVD